MDAVLAELGMAPAAQTNAEAEPATEAQAQAEAAAAADEAVGGDDDDDAAEAGGNEKAQSSSSFMTVLLLPLAQHNSTAIGLLHVPQKDVGMLVSQPCQVGASCHSVLCAILCLCSMFVLTTAPAFTMPVC